MISFAKQSKLEILGQPIEDAGCAFAFLSGLFHGCGHLSKSSLGLRADIVTDIVEIFDYVNFLVKKLYGDELKLEISDDYIINKTTYYRIMFPEKISPQVLEDCGIIERREGDYSVCRQVPKNLLVDEEGKRYFVQGAYLGCSTSSIKLSELGGRQGTTGYHMEFSSHNLEFLEGLKEIIDEYNIVSRISQRKNLHILYLKDSESIKDLLALVGATDSVLSLSNEMATRTLRNTVNRQVNCINANINKTVDASLKQIEAIKYLNKVVGLDNLPDDLQEVAVLRLANQQESMEELLKLSTIQLTKSGLNHRFRKLIKLAQDLKSQE